MIIQKFQAHKFERLGTLIRFSQACLVLAKNDFYTWYLLHTDSHYMQNLMNYRKLVVIWEFILHFPIIRHSLYQSGWGRLFSSAFEKFLPSADACPILTKFLRHIMNTTNILFWLDEILKSSLQEEISCKLFRALMLLDFANWANPRCFRKHCQALLAIVEFKLYS